MVVIQMNKKEAINYAQITLDKYQDILIFDELVEILGIGENTTYKLLKDKKIYSKKIGKEYKIPKICVIAYMCNKSVDKANFLKYYGDILDFKEVRRILRNPCRNTLYKILKNKEMYFKIIANEYKIPKSSLIEYIFKDYSSAL